MRPLLLMHQCGFRKGYNKLQGYKAYNEFCLRLKYQNM